MASLPRDIRGVLFDKDGTLIDFEKTWFAIGDHMAREAAGGDRERADRLLGMAGYDFATRTVRADSVFAAGTNADIVAIWYPRAGADERQALTARFDAFTATEGAKRAVPVEGVRRSLEALHGAGYRMGVATNDSTAGAEMALVTLGWSQLFDAVYGYDAVARPKPAPDTVFAFCDLTGLRVSQVAVIGDNRHDLDMARSAGAGLAIGVLSGTGTRDTLASCADALLESAAELPGFLAGIRPL